MSELESPNASRAAVNSPNTSSRLRLTYAFYLALAAVTAIAGRPDPLSPLSSHAINCLALLLVITACLGRVWCSAFIGGYKNAALIMDGPYSIARHPLYSFSWIGAVGLGVATHSFTLTLVTAVFIAALLSLSARREDEFLSQAYGDHFADYARTTPRFWPRWRSYRVAESVHIKPAILRKSFLDAGAFVLLYLAIDTLRVLRETGALPTFCKIP